MKEFAEKLRLVEQQIAEEKGSFLLFALFLREDAPDLWDVLVSAPWIESNKGEALRYIAPKLQSVATPEELAKLSRIVIIEKSQPALAAFQSAFHVEHGLADVRNSNFFGLPIEHAYIITSRKEDI
jgi:hypothetical protein